MKHRRGNDLSAQAPAASYTEHDPAMYHTLKGLREWEVLGAKCAACGHVGWVNKDALLARFGDRYLMNLHGQFRCRCGNRDGNTVLIGRLPR